MQSSSILREDPKGFAHLARSLPSNRRDGTLTPQCLWRWATRGVRTRDGRTVRLEAIWVAGKFRSSLAAIERFVAAQNESLETPCLPQPSRSVLKRARASEVAAEELEAEGI